MTAAGDVVLCINSGSSSLKFAVFAADAQAVRALASGAVERIGARDGEAWLRFSRAAPGAPADPRPQAGAFPDHAAALRAVFDLLGNARLPSPTIAGHRVVHGGPGSVEPQRVDAGLMERLRAAVPLAPLHLPASIAGIEAVEERRGDLPQVACFDTAFHAAMPERASRLPLPPQYHADGIRRYGFHGLSYEHTMSVLGPDAPPRVVIAHLGNGSSLVAVERGVSIDTTMGFTPTGGVLMGTRTGDLDPGVLVYLARHRGYSADAIERLVEREGGLLAVGGTSDMKALLARAPTDERARLAVSMFAYAVRKAIGAFAAALGGLDVLVFTGGIGENAPEVRAEACRGLEAFGVRLDDARNRDGEAVISSSASACAVRVVVADEDRVIARHARWVVRSGRADADGAGPTGARSKP